MARRFKSTTYGEKGGEGPTRGRTASVYEATLPDGRKVKVRSFKDHSDNAVVSAYLHEGTWYPNGAYDADNLPNWLKNRENATLLKATRIKIGSK